MGSDSFIEAELASVEKCIGKVPYSELVACVPLMVRVRMTKTKQIQLDVCMQFPPDYPNQLLLVEFKSKTLPEKFLDSLQIAVESNQQDFVERQQILLVLKFVAEFIDKNPLCVCAGEISSLRSLLNADTDVLKVRQKSSAIVLECREASYHTNLKVTIPEDYPESQVSIECVKCNFPPPFSTWLVAQATEIARRCVQPSLMRKQKGKAISMNEPFVPKPSLEPVGQFLIGSIKRYALEPCSLCQEQAFPPDPQAAISDQEHSGYVERVYCSHLFHHGCLDEYMKTPPFKGGKKCPACKEVIYHEKWNVEEQTAEERWAHKQAKERELEEIEDFLS